MQGPLTRFRFTRLLFTVAVNIDKKAVNLRVWKIFASVD